MPDDLDEATSTQAKSLALDMHLAYGEAAYMLLDSLLLLLLERRILSVDEVAGALDSAISTKRQMVMDGEHPKISAPAVGLLSRLSISLDAHALANEKQLLPSA